MKYCSIVLGLLLTLLPAFAFGSEQSKMVQIPQKVLVGTKQLKPGHYKIKFDDSQQQTQVSFEQNGKTIATAPARVVHKSMTEPDLERADIEVNNAGGHPELRRVYLKTEQLVFGQNQAASNNSAKSTPPAQ